MRNLYPGSLYRLMAMLLALTFMSPAFAAKTVPTEQTGEGVSTADPVPDSPQTPPPSAPTPRDDVYLLVCNAGGSNKVSYEITTNAPGGYCEPTKTKDGKTFGAICWGGNNNALDVSSATCKSGCGTSAKGVGHCLDSSGRTTR